MSFKRWLLVTFFSMGIISFAAGIMIGRTLKPDFKTLANNPLLYSGRRPPAKPLDTTLGTLISKKPEELEKTDIATLYLASRASLPEAENVDLEQTRTRFETLAKIVQKQTEATYQYQHSLNNKFQDTPEAKIAVMMDVLRAYEQEAERRMDTSRPENLFIHNHVQQAQEEQHFASPVQAALAGQPYHPYVPRPEDSIPEIQHTVFNLNNPILIVAIGRLLGYPLYLVKAPDHLFARWQSPDGKTLFDIDEIGKYESNAKDPIRYDNDYDRPPDDQVKEEGYFKSLNHADLFAFFMQQRGDYMRDHQRPFDSELAYTVAHRFAPDTPGYDDDMLSEVGTEMQFVGVTWKDLEKNCPDYFNLSPPKPDKTVVIP